jgi:membrane-associated phospholipid phosphatase
MATNLLLRCGVASPEISRSRCFSRGHPGYKDRHGRTISECPTARRRPPREAALNPLVLVMVLGVSAIAVVSLLSLARRPREAAVARGERWIVHHTPRRLRPLVEILDRRVIGGASLALGLSVIFASSLFVGWLLDTIDSNRGFARYDEAAAEWGADHATSASTQLLRLFTHLGGSAVVALVLIVVAALSRQRLAALLYFATVLGGIVLLNNTLKLIVARERPAIAQLTGHSGSSFPSGHSAVAAACWSAIALVLTQGRRGRARRAAAATAIGIALLVAVTRVLLGVHWLTDVLAGLAVGWTWFFIASLAWGGRLLRLSEPAERVSRDVDEPLGTRELSVE